jgi:hypothetical protein
VATNWVQNFYHPINPDKYIGDLKNIVFRSSWERHLFQYCDNVSSVLKWSSEPFAIKYWDESSMKTRRYFPDVYMEIIDRDGNIKKYLAEVKPYRQTQPPKEGRKKTRTFINECKTYQKNISKWKFAEEFCKKNGMEFIILTETHLGLKKS